LHYGSAGLDIDVEKLATVVDSINADWLQPFLVHRILREVGPRGCGGSAKRICRVVKKHRPWLGRRRRQPVAGLESVDIRRKRG
jgi:hypothetical protein